MDLRVQKPDPSATDAAVDFVRFCHRRKRAGWPELYDEMCAVASRGLYHGWGFAELGEHGIAFGLAEMPRLAGLVIEVARQDSERRGRALVGVVAPMPLAPEVRDDAREDQGRAQVLVAAAG
ncbi:MAG: hypothetical protein ACXWM8_04985 [Candidatus Limnocylindrales bacterium]